MMSWDERISDVRKAQPVSPGAGAPFSPLVCLSYVNDVGMAIVKDAAGADPPDGENRVDRRTACLNQANAFREKAIADPERHDQWIDEAVEWLERAMEAGRRVAVTAEVGDDGAVPEEIVPPPADDL